jgi:hypothetical protein
MRRTVLLAGLMVLMVASLTVASGSHKVSAQEPPDGCSQAMVAAPAALAIARAAAQVPTEYHGNTQSRIFHGPDCRYYNCAHCTKIFKTRQEAIEAGYRPCKICRP